MSGNAISSNVLHFAILSGIILSVGSVMYLEKSSSVFSRVEPELKAQAEQVLSQLGIPMANAINLFLRQIVLQNGIPFALELPQNKPLNYAMLSPEQLDVEIQKGFDDLNVGRVSSSKQVRKEMLELIGALFGRSIMRIAQNRICETYKYIFQMCC